MLEIAKYKRQRSNTVYLNMDAEHLNFKEKFDMIVSRTTFHHLNDIPHVIKQMKGILNDGGKIVILDNVSKVETPADRKSTRLNSSHVAISYAVFCLKKKKIKDAIALTTTL